MEEDELNERGLFVASIMSRVRDLKSKYKNEDTFTDELNFTKVSADTTDNSGTVNQIMMTANNPEDWLSFLLKLEKKYVPETDTGLLNRLIGRYSQAIAALSAEQYSQNESYACILVRFAELKAIQDPEEARDQFHLARLNCRKLAFVHVAFAQFELSQGNIKKSKQLLEKAVECCAVPAEMLEIALKNLSLQKRQLLSEEEKENLAIPCSQNITGSFQNRKIETREIIGSASNICLGQRNESPQQTEFIPSGRKPLKQLNQSNQKCPFGRVPIRLKSDNEDDDDTDDSVKIDVPYLINVIKRKISGSKDMNLINSPLLESKPNRSDSYNPEGLKPLPSRKHIEVQLWDEESSEVSNSTITLKKKYDSSYDVKRKETEVHHEEPRTIGSVCLEMQQQRSLSLENCSKENEPSIINPSGTKLYHLEAIHKKNSEEENRCFEQPVLQVFKRFSPPETTSKSNNQTFVGITPCNNTLNNYMACFSTPVINNDFLPGSKVTTPYNQFSYLHPCTPTTPFQVQSGLQISASAPSNECIFIKGKWYSVLKQIGSGGSSKVFQVLDEKKHLYAIKYVNLEEADQQTIESYKNEIVHLNKLQQHSDKIIRLYDYEINEKSIYMVMECGNIDLNSWLKKKKTINPWERKSYWKNMLEAVHTIHQHGIVHSDLKPANFLLVDGMLKLIDFGIANQMQPDVTSIVKDSQVGTVNYMSPEAIKDMSSCAENGKPRSKICPKNDVWSLGCILYCMTYGRTPFQHIKNHITKLHAIIDPSYEIAFPDIAEKDLQDVLKRCLVRNPKQRISVSELLIHPYVHIQANSQTSDTKGTTEEMKRILGHLIGLNSPNSITRAARTLYEQCSNGEGLDVSAFANSGKS
ncbi:dual specificity protein kinase TTK [Eublepharis macularius]|uniref:Dual specificity protein kinase TTK n=1 Tax=Eublepharis macularius TaxID=481883 RepID=A0AA97L1R2_EUBMA|nr:dual specificity protein kinase TTK [Eublepharis macularius]XP_054839111.1 dual specificity protein kinase TTK [Eublepharis macularius]XP_054839119.1 dual specificity protein kinase TTK [Eublepharis macularius]